MADGGDGLPLARRGGGEQRPGGGEENGLPLALPHLAQEIAVEHGGRAAAAGGSGVHILVLPVIQQQAAVLELGAHVHTVPLEEVPDDGVAQLSQVTGEDQVEVRGLVPGVPKEGGKGVVGCRG